MQVTMDTPKGTKVRERDEAGTYQTGTVFYVDEVFVMHGEVQVGVKPDSVYSSQWEVFTADELEVVG